MILEIPTLLVLLGAALMTVAIFAPKRRPVELLAGAGPAAFNAWHTLSEPPIAPPSYAEEHVPPAACTGAGLTWPALVDSCALDLDEAARIALILALAALRQPWAQAILQRAIAEETDASVRAALHVALV